MEPYVREQAVTRIKELLSNIPDLDVIDVTVFSHRSDTQIRVIVDHESGGITLATCADLNARIVRLIEETFPEENVSVEVNSPGLDRFLTREKDFIRQKGKCVGVWLKEPLPAGSYKEGEIMDVRDASLILKCGTAEERIPVSLINKAKQIVKWR